ncbi:MAG: PIG-L deacetylase family protein [bacterium]
MNLLAVVAHPDDASIFCGGTLAKHANRGDEVQILYMTRGEYGGGADLSEEEIATRREQEAREAAQVLGASVSFMEFKDGRMQYSLENRRLLMDEIREVRPDLLLTHNEEDPHPDHRVTSRLLSDAYYQASLPRVESDHEVWDPENVFYFGRPSTEFYPDLYVDVSEVQDVKEKAVRQHKSQLAFLEDHEGIDSTFDDLIDDVRVESRVYGRRSGVQYAEGFTSLKGTARDFLG